MNVGLAVESDVSVEHLMPAVRGVNNAIEVYFEDRSYGSDLTNIGIGLILVAGSISGRLHPVRAFRYRRFDREKSRITGKIFEIHTTAEWDVKPDFAAFGSMSLGEARNYLCQFLIASTHCLEEHRNKYPNFDVAGFRTDFEACLRSA